MTRTPSFSLLAFEFALFPSQSGLPLPLLSPSILAPSHLFALQNMAMPSAKVSLCTSTNNRSSAPALGALWPLGARRALRHGGTTGVPQISHPGCSFTARGGVQQRGLQGTPAPWPRHSGRFPVHAGKSPPAGVCALSPASAAWIALLFLSGLPFAGDGGERWTAWGRVCVEGSWTWVRQEKKKFGRVAK